MTETLAYGYSSESTQWELSNEYFSKFLKELMIKPWCNVKGLVILLWESLGHLKKIDDTD